MRKNPLLYSDYNEIEEVETIEPIEEKRSFLFYFIVFANTVLVFLVLAILWFLYSKPTDQSFDQQLKSWTQEVFSTTGSGVEKTAVVPDTPPIAAEEPKPDLAAEKERARVELENKLAVEAEKQKLEALALKLKQEKEKAEAIQKAMDDAKQAAMIKESEKQPIVENTPVEAAIVPDAARAIPEQPSNTAKTQLEQILETMKNQ